MTATERRSTASTTARGALALVSLAVCLTLGIALVPGDRASGSERRVSVIVRETGPGSGPEQAVQEMGGSVGRHIGLINAFIAEIPATGIEVLERLDEVHSVTPDAPVKLNATSVDGYEPKKDDGSWVQTAKAIGATKMWKDGYTGQGIDVALIDSGVAPVEGLNSGNVLDGPDLSFESQAADLIHLDTYGHGTHMAGLIAGRDAAVDMTDTKGLEKAAEENFVGMAPGARLVSIKVASSDGATDVSQVIAAIDWVVQHAHSDGLDIRVLNLSFGTDGVQSYLLDPLSFAAEMAWRKGIVVAVAAGNEGFGNQKLNNPAYDPYVLAVGAVDMRGKTSAKEAEVCDFSSVGNATRTTDVVAPGRSIVSLRDPGSRIDQDHPNARRGSSRFFKGSGTSQAAAITSGGAALLLSQDPSLTPDQVKGLLMETADEVKRSPRITVGSGLIDLQEASKRLTEISKKGPIPAYTQSHPVSTGWGSLELARGSVHVLDKGKLLKGEADIFGAWDGRSWTSAAMLGRSWTNGDWNGRSWTGDSWTRTLLDRPFVDRRLVGRTLVDRPLVDRAFMVGLRVDRWRLGDSGTVREVVGGRMVEFDVEVTLIGAQIRDYRPRLSVEGRMRGAERTVQGRNRRSTQERPSHGR